MKLSISDLLNDAWELTKKHGIILALFLLVVYVLQTIFALSSLPSGIWEAAMSGDDAAVKSMSEAPNFLLQGGMMIISFFMGIALYNTSLRLARGSNENLSLSSFQLSGSTYFKLFVCYLVYSVGSFAVSFLWEGLKTGTLYEYWPALEDMRVVAWVLLIAIVLIGLYFCLRLAFIPLYLIDHPQVTLGEALQKSWALTQGRVLQLLGILILACIIGCLGLLACCIGVCYTMIIANFVFVLTYLYFLQENNEGEATPTHSYDATTY